MLAVDQRLAVGKFEARMLLQVHDELLFECPQSEVVAISALATEAMTSVASLRVPLVVDVGQGHSWADAH
jgi:DNA polymerase-1